MKRAIGSITSKEVVCELVDYWECFYACISWSSMEEEIAANTLSDLYLEVMWGRCFPRVYRPVLDSFRGALRHVKAYPGIDV